MLSPQTFSDLRQALQHKAVQLLEPPRSKPNEEAVRKRLHKQRDHLLTFLDHDGVEATNNLAERQLRPAVIARKISRGNKTPKGARTWQTCASLAATCAQRATSFVATLARLRSKGANRSWCQKVEQTSRVFHVQATGRFEVEDSLNTYICIDATPPSPPPGSTSQARHEALGRGKRW